MVRYGANGTYAYKTGTNSIGCNNTVFGDPNRGVKKYCWISTSPTPYMQDATQYTLAFRDEFDGAALDANKWNTRIWYDQESTVNNYGVENGYLKIWPQPDANGVVTRRILTTKGKFEMSYGFFEMEAKLPVGDGPWPAFWLLNSDNPDAGEPEIDIMEAYPGDKSGYWADPSNQHAVAYNLSWYQIGNGTQDADGNDTPRDSVQYYTGDILSSGFHKYGLKWEPNKLSYYFDGKLVYTASIPMSKKMYILLDMQYDGSQSPSGDVDETTPLGKSNSFAINYVRAWKLK